MHPFIFERMPARIRDETRSMVDLEGESEEKVVVGTPPHPLQTISSYSISSNREFDRA